jgi:hypothetical protein
MRAQAVEKWAPYFQALERMLTNNGSPHLVGNKVCMHKRHRGLAMLLQR